MAHRLRSFSVGLTDYDPRTNDGPLNSPFQICATHNDLLAVLEAISLKCAATLYAWGRYLFVAASVNEYFHLGEVEVYDGMLLQYHRMYVDIINQQAQYTPLK